MRKGSVWKTSSLSFSTDYSGLFRAQDETDRHEDYALGLRASQTQMKQSSGRGKGGVLKWTPNSKPPSLQLLPLWVAMPGEDGV